AGAGFLEPHRFGKLLLVEIADRGNRKLNCLAYIRGERLEGRVELGLGDEDAGWWNIGLVEFLRQPRQCLVPFGSYRLDDWPDFVDEWRNVGIRALHQRGT